MKSLFYLGLVLLCLIYYDGYEDDQENILMQKEAYQIVLKYPNRATNEKARVKNARRLYKKCIDASKKEKNPTKAKILEMAADMYICELDKPLEKRSARGTK